MICTIHHAIDFVEDIHDAEYIREYLTRPGSDFRKKLTGWLTGETRPTTDDGHIAIVEDQGEIIGWARTERWWHGQDLYDTLEAFVAKEYRRRGIAAFAAAGLASRYLAEEGGAVAVFRPQMILVAKRAGLHPKLFELRETQSWEPVE